MLKKSNVWYSESHKPDHIKLIIYNMVSDITPVYNTLLWLTACEMENSNKSTK